MKLQRPNLPISLNSIALPILTALLSSLCCITPVLAFVAGIGGMASSFSWLDPFRPYMLGLTALFLGVAWWRHLAARRKANQPNCDCAAPKFWNTTPFLAAVTGGVILMSAFPYYAHVFYGFSDSSATSETVAQSGSGEGTAAPQPASAAVAMTDSTKADGNESKQKDNPFGQSSTQIPASSGTSGKSSEEQTGKNPFGKGSVTIPVEGMTCQGCASHIEHAVSGVEGTKQASASYEDGYVKVAFDSTKTTEEELKQAINNTGYRAK